MFQGPWFISSLRGLVTVGFRQNNESVGRPALTDERALTLVREVADTDRRSTVGDTAEMCDLKRTTVLCIFKVDVQTLEVYSAWRRIFLKTIKPYKKDSI